jgi:hypothetical protein
MRQKSSESLDPAFRQEVEARAEDWPYQGEILMVQLWRRSVTGEVAARRAAVQGWSFPADTAGIDNVPALWFSRFSFKPVC